jgi:hypothetical protein
MDYAALKKSLSDYAPEKVSVFISHLKELEAAKDKDQKQVNFWFKNFTNEQAVEVYKKVAMDNLFIDGTTITVGFKYGKIIVTYNFQAYKNKLLNIYPESKFDIQLVKDGDYFSFEKVNGRVEYVHKINNPFKTDAAILGVYCIIKNNRGEFLETLDMSEIQKMKNVATTKNIWNSWESEMVLKSVMKRACKRHFNDLVVNIEALDNENYDLDNVSVDSSFQVKINNAKTESELTTIYKESTKDLKENPAFLKLLSERKLEVMNDEPPKMIIKDELMPQFLKSYKEGKIDLEYLESKYIISQEQLNQFKANDK